MFDNNAVTVRKENRLVKLKEQLTKVNEAYERALQAQAWKSSDGMSERSVNNANIAELYREKVELERKIDRLESEIDGTSISAFRLGVMRSVQDTSLRRTYHPMYMFGSRSTRTKATHGHRIR